MVTMACMYVHTHTYVPGTVCTYRHICNKECQKGLCAHKILPQIDIPILSMKANKLKIKIEKVSRD